MCVLCGSPRTRMRMMSTVLNNATTQGLNAQVVRAKASVCNVLGPIPRGANRTRCIRTTGAPTVRSRHDVRRIHVRRPPQKVLEAGLVPRNLLRGDEAPCPSSQMDTCLGLMTSVHQTRTDSTTKQLKQLETR